MFKTRLKLILLITAIMLLAILSAAIAFAGGNYPWTKNKQLIPNISAIAPEKGHSGCVTQTTNKAPFGTYTSVAGYASYDAEVVTATGAAEPVKWELDGVEMSTGPSFKFTNSGANTYSRAVQRPYSGAWRTLKSCVRRQ